MASLPKDELTKEQQVPLGRGREGKGAEFFRVEGFWD